MCCGNGCARATEHSTASGTKRRSVFGPLTRQVRRSLRGSPLLCPESTHAHTASLSSRSRCHEAQTNRHVCEAQTRGTGDEQLTHETMTMRHTYVALVHCLLPLYTSQTPLPLGNAIQLGPSLTASINFPVYNLWHLLVRGYPGYRGPWGFHFHYQPSGLHVKNCLLAESGWWHVNINCSVSYGIRKKGSRL